MSCMLRAGGENFDVDAFLGGCDIEPVKVWRKGDLKFPASQPDGPRIAQSGVSFEVSHADFLDLDIQFADARAWFTENRDFVRSLCQFPGVERVVVDFGAEIHPPGWCFFTIPPDLQVLIGSLDVHLMLSVYPVDDDAE